MILMCKLTKNYLAIWAIFAGKLVCQILMCMPKLLDYFWSWKEYSKFFNLNFYQRILVFTNNKILGVGWKNKFRYEDYFGILW